MELSASNQLRGTVTYIKAGAVMAEMMVQVSPGNMTAAITDKSRDRLRLKMGDEVSVIVKATEVLLDAAALTRRGRDPAGQQLAHTTPFPVCWLVDQHAVGGGEQ